MKSLDEYNGSPEHGILCTEYNVLVLVKEAEEKTAGGLVLPEEVRTKDQNAAVFGKIAGMSPMAFKSPDWPDDVSKPVVGDSVYFGRYAGASSRIKGADGKEYQVIKDNDIMAVYRGENE